ncbi:hypothetical protein HY025_04680 [Candidatus Daviesbacteria bacterium]|nr:hypothetical protein [Candidatus Daviesbacteria bacterium]
MKPKFLEETFRQLDHPVGYFPFTAVEYLQKHRLTKELEDKIVFALTHVDNTSGTADYYAFVAEEHLSKKFIEPIVNHFTKKGVQTYEHLEEELNYLLQKLATKYPDVVMEKVMPALEKVFYDEDNQTFWPYLFEVFQFVDKRKYTPWFIKVMKMTFELDDTFLDRIIYLGIPETIPHIRKVLDSNNWNPDDINIEKLEQNYTKLVNGKFPQNAPKPSLLTRDKWKHYLMDAERHKLSDKEVEALSRIPTPVYIIEKS